MILDADSLALRGGAYTNPTSYQRSAYRLRLQPANRFNSVGLRLARTLNP
jgi:formylglycine-generating enzyme required for sulfatase activity